MNTKDSPVDLTDEQKKYLQTLSELDRIHYLATMATDPRGAGVAALCGVLKVSKNTIYKGIYEIRHKITPGKGRIRKPGGGAKRKITKHPEWKVAFDNILNSHLAGLPQDQGTKWLDIGVSQIQRLMKGMGHQVSEYIVKQMVKESGLRKRAFSKSMPLSAVKDRNAQFEKIATVRSACLESGIPIISIDTKKKEMVGNFKRGGTVLCTSAPRAYDHDFASFSEGMIVPHGIYDIADNTGYLTIGTSHDTSEFVCDNIERVWNEHLKQLYPKARLLVVLCDGGGSNACKHHIVKQDLMNLTDRIGMMILMMHYPPYCSKFNPIEHRLFSQITHSWSGMPILSICNACLRAANTVTKTGLKVFAIAVEKTYEIKRKVKDAYKEQLKRRVLFDQALHKWNYLIYPSNFSHVIF